MTRESQGWFFRLLPGVGVAVVCLGALLYYAAFRPVAHPDDGELSQAIEYDDGARAASYLAAHPGLVNGREDRPHHSWLHDAVQQHSLRVAAVLISRGADIEATDSRGRTPLQCAMIRDDDAMAQLLIDYGADVSVRDKSGRTPLHLAAARGNLELVKLLLAHGADPLAKDDTGKTPLALAERGKYPAIAAALRAWKK